MVILKPIKLARIYLTRVPLGGVLNPKPVSLCLRLSISMILLFHGCGLLGSLLYPTSAYSYKRIQPPMGGGDTSARGKAGELFVPDLIQSIPLTQFHKGVLMSPLACLLMVTS